MCTGLEREGGLCTGLEREGGLCTGLEREGGLCTGLEREGRLCRIGEGGRVVYRCVCRGVRRKLVCTDIISLVSGHETTDVELGSKVMCSDIICEGEIQYSN